MGGHRRIGEIQPFAELAQGTATVVYKGYQPSLERFVLLKVLRPAFSQDAELVERFEQEAHLAASIQHPNVVAIYAHGQDDGQPYLAAEFVDGVDLKTLLASGPLPPELATFVALEAARGLQAAHRRDVLHRDIKPENLLISHEGQVKLTDFGLASLIDESADVEVRGTWSYLAPEVIRGATPTKAADLFSLGATLFEMLTARVPFSGPDTSAVLDAILHHDPLPLLDRLAAVPDRLHAVCERLLAKHPPDRYGSAAELIDALGTVQSEQGWAARDDALARYLAAPDAYASPPPATVPVQAAEASADADSASDTPASPSKNRGPQRALLAVLIAGLALTGTLLAVSVGTDSPSNSAQVDRTASMSTSGPITPPSSLPAADSAVARTVTPDTTRVLPSPAAGSDMDTITARPDAAESPRTDTAASLAPPTTSGTVNQALADPSDASGVSPSTPPALGALAIQVGPWAEVYVNDTLLGRTPLDAPVALPAGTHTLTLRHPQFPDSTTTVALAPGDTTTLTVSLWDLVGTVALEVSPWAEVYVDGERRDTTPLERPLIVPPGLHTLTLRNPALGRLDTTITVRRGEERTLRLNLNRLLAQ